MNTTLCLLTLIKNFVLRAEQKYLIPHKPLSCNHKDTLVLSNGETEPFVKLSFYETHLKNDSTDKVIFCRKRTSIVQETAVDES